MTVREQAAFAASIEAVRQMALTSAVTIEARRAAGLAEEQHALGQSTQETRS